MSVIRPMDLPRLRDQLARWFAQNSDGQKYLRDVAIAIRHPDPRNGRHNYVADVASADILRWLHTADLYLVTDAMTEVSVQAGKAMPGFRLHPDDQPSRVGFLLWDRSLPLTVTYVGHGGHVERTVELRGVLWAPAETRFGSGVALLPIVDTESGLQAALDDGVDPRSPSLRRLVAQQGPLSVTDAIPLVYDDDYHITNPLYPFIVATWLIMGQHIAVTIHHRPKGNVVRAYARQGRPEPVVRVITLRHTTTAGEHSDESEAHREYRHRWVVEGHWHTYLVGPGRSERRPTWVCDYVKGPEGAPLIGGERIHVLRR